MGREEGFSDKYMVSMLIVMQMYLTIKMNKNRLN